MTDQDNIHFANDEDLLGRYVLGSLSKEERARFDVHVASCQTCARAVHQERLLAAGIKRQGRDELKQALRARLDASKPGLPWPKILAAAAVVAILGGVGVYYRYFTAAPPVPEIAERPPLQAQEAEPSDIPQPSGGSVSDEAKRPAALSAPSSKGTLDAKAKTEIVVAAPLPEKITKKESFGETARADRLSARNALEGGLNEKAPEAFWAEGSVEGPGEEREVAFDQAVSGKAHSELRRMMAASPQAASAKDNSLRDQEIPQFVLKQASSTALPAVRQKTLQAAAQTTVQTKVERKGEVTTMTLFLDTLMDEGALKKARVQALGDDSVVVMLGLKKISYKFPPGSTAQTQTKK